MVYAYQVSKISRNDSYVSRITIAQCQTKSGTAMFTMHDAYIACYPSFDIQGDGLAYTTNNF